MHHPRHEWPLTGRDVTLGRYRSSTLPTLNFDNFDNFDNKHLKIIAIPVNFRIAMPSAEASSFVHVRRLLPLESRMPVLALASMIS